MGIKRNVTKEIKTIARERVGRVKGSKVITPKPKRKEKHPEPANRMRVEDDMGRPLEPLWD